MVFRPRTRAKLEKKQKRCTKCGCLIGVRKRCKRCHKLQ